MQRFAWRDRPRQCDAPHIGEGGIPQFAEERGWLKLPAKWRLGNTSAVSVDAQGHVWVLHRPRTLPENLRAMAAPPVLEFDAAGNFIQGWGGSSRQVRRPRYEWPENEHGLHVDPKGFVWVVGNAMPQDGQILKFTKAGKFVLQIGKSGQTGGNTTQFLLGASGLRVHPKTNELFVSDGYGNSRVMVYDAETGAFKRMWGAYGRKPVDPPSIAIGAPTSPTSQIPAGIAERLQHFKTVHDVALSNDDFVYIADRGNKRIQVFTLDGKYVAQQFVGLDSPEYQQARSTAFSPDPQQRFLYVAGSPVIYILNRKTLEILGRVRHRRGAGQSARPSDCRGPARQHLRAAGRTDGLRRKGRRLNRSEVRVQRVFAAATVSCPVNVRPGASQVWLRASRTFWRQSPDAC